MLTQNQTIPFTSILIEMANADGLIAGRECVAVKKILSSLGVDNETFLLAREIPLPLAIDVMENASTEGKIFLAKKLVEVIDADEKVTDTELTLLNAVAHRLKIDSYFK